MMADEEDSMSAQPEVKTSDETDVESILAFSSQLVADSLGIELLHTKAANYLSREVIFKMKYIIQNAERYRRKAKRARLSSKDINDSIVQQKGQSQFGITSRNFIPLNKSTVAGGVGSGTGSVTSTPGSVVKDLFACEDEEIDLNSILQSQLPKYPAESHLKCHWLVVDDKQPSVPENPLLVDHQTQNKSSLTTPKSTHPSVSNKNSNNNLLSNRKPSNQISTPNNNTNSSNQSGQNSSSSSSSVVKTKPIRYHELSIEQQLYFKEITEVCMSTNEERKTEALASLSTDPGLYALMPRFSSFIAHGVRLNVLHRSLAILIYLMRMLSALINNPNISLEKYLHELVPSVITCIVNRQLVDQHWALRSFAARCLASLCQSYSNSVNNLQPRAVNVLKQALNEMTTIGFPTLFGVVCAIGELGHETVRTTLIPYIKNLGNFIQDTVQQCTRREYHHNLGSNLSPDSSVDDAALKRGTQELQNKLVKVLASYIQAEMPDITELNDFKVHFGYLGPIIYNEVSKLRQQQQNNQQGMSCVTLVNPSPNNPVPYNTQQQFRHNTAMINSAGSNNSQLLSPINPPYSSANSSRMTTMLPPNAHHQSQGFITSVNNSQGYGGHIVQGNRRITNMQQQPQQQTYYLTGSNSNHQQQFGGMSSAHSPPDIKEFNHLNNSAHSNQNNTSMNYISSHSNNPQVINISHTQQAQQQQQHSMNGSSSSSHTISISNFGTVASNVQPNHQQNYSQYNSSHSSNNSR